MKYFSFIILSLMFFACHNKVETVTLEVPVLRGSMIYKVDSVRAYMETYKDTNKRIAASYIDKGTKEKDNPEKSIYYFKRAITLNPTLTNYKLLAQALNSTHNYNELQDLYSLLANPIYERKANGRDTTVYIFGRPDEEIFYQYTASTILTQHYLPADNIYMARDLGLDISMIKSKLLTDERIKMDTASLEYKDMMLQFLPYEEIQAYTKNPGVFRGFVASIKDTSAIFTIDEKSVQQFNYTDFNGMNYEDGPQITAGAVYIYYLKEKQTDKNRWLKFNFNHAFKVSPSITGIVYVIDTSELACPVEMRHLYHQLVTYDNSGNIIDSKIIAFQAGEQLQTAYFNNGKFTITTYKRTWKKPYKKEDFDNDLVNSEKISETDYEILADGKIKEVNSMASAQR
jgi:hypothetical protein